MYSNKVAGKIHIKHSPFGLSESPPKVIEVGGGHSMSNDPVFGQFGTTPLSFFANINLNELPYCVIKYAK